MIFLGSILMCNSFLNVKIKLHVTRTLTQPLTPVPKHLYETGGVLVKRHGLEDKKPLRQPDHVKI